MVECVLAWIMLFCGIVFSNPLFFVASAVYAIAAQVGGWGNKKERGGE